MFRKVFVSLIVIGILCISSGYAADSPQFRGINRDGKFPEKGLMKEWPASGPNVVWEAKGIADGYASASVAGDSIYVPGMKDGNKGSLFVLGLDGAIKKEIPYGPETEDDQAPGPRATPTMDGNRAYLMSGLGTVYCINVDIGEVAWKVDALKKFKGKMITWTISESVLIDGNNVICTPGGPDASVVALDKMTGETVWTSKGLSEASAYCSPDVIERGGRRIILTMTEKSVVGIDAKTGQLLWKHKHETDYDIHGTMPVYADGLIYYTAGYDSGGGMLELSDDGASVTPKWTDKNLDCQHHGVVLVDGYIYGTAHEGNKLICLELKTGKMMWSTKDVTQGVTVYADGMLYIYEGPKKGVVSLVKANPEKFELKGSVKVKQGTDKHWAHPTISNGRLYIRHGKSLIAYDLKAK